MGHKNLNVKQEIADNYRNTQLKYAEMQKLLQDRYGVTQGRADQLYGEVKQGYEGYLGPNGGLNPDTVTGVRGDISQLRELGATGGLDEEAIARFRGNGYFDNLVATGGYTDADKTNIRSRATSVIPSMYDATKNAMASQNAAQGGYSPGYTYQVAKASREAGRDASSAARDAEIGINDAVRQGKYMGAEGMSNAENALQTLRTGNMFRGLGMASDTDMRLGESIRSGQEYGQTGLAHMWDSQEEESMGNIALQMKNWGMSDELLQKWLSMYPQGRSVWAKLLKAGIVGAATVVGGAAGTALAPGLGTAAGGGLGLKAGLAIADQV